MNTKKSLRFLLTALFVVFVCLGNAHAATYPKKPVTLIIPFSAGGSHDLNARIVTSIIPQYLGQPMIVKLMPGAGGQLATAAAVRAKADGYTLIFTHNFVDQLQPLVEKLPYDTYEALVTICRVNYGPAMAYVMADKPWKTLDEVLQYAKKNPGKLKFACTGNWAALFTFGAMLFDRAGGVQAHFLPYKGGGPSLQAMLAGEADFSFLFPMPLIDLHRQGKIRILATAGEERMKQIPEVPTFKELGYGTGYMMDRTVMLPRKTPQDRVQILRDAFRKLNKDKSFRKFMARVGENIEYIDGPDYEKLRLQQRKEYGELIKAVIGK
jgi:tripartite-type tricarboxylate transporter receptor subunit TctC